MAKIILWLFIVTIAFVNASIYKNSPYVNELHPFDLYELIRDQVEGLWIVQFYNSSDDNSEYFSTNYSIAAKSMLGYVKSTALDIDRHQFTNLAMRLTKTPAYYFYGFYKHMPEQFTSISTVDDLHEQTAKELVHYFEERSVYRFVHHRKNMEMGTADLHFKMKQSLAPWLIVFYKRDHPRCVELAPIWERLVALFHERIHFGSVNNPLYNALEVTSDDVYPIIYYYPRGRKKDKQPEVFNETATFERLEVFLDAKITTSRVPQVTSVGVVEPCLKRSFCIFAFLPPLQTCDAECRARNIDLLSAECHRCKRHAWKWFWNEYGDQPDIERAFGVGVAEDDATLATARNGTVVVLNVQAAIYMRTSVPAELTHDVLANITDGIKGDMGFTFHVQTTIVPDIRRLKNWEDGEGLLRDEL